MFTPQIQSSTRQPGKMNPEQPGYELSAEHYKPQVKFCTTQNHPDDPVEITFKVINSEGREETVLSKNNDSATLLAITQEGQDWLQRQQQSASRLRRVA